MTALLAEAATMGRKIARPVSRQRLPVSGLPPLWWGARRRHLSLLILAGLGQAMAAGLSARLFSQALAPAGAASRGLLFGVLVAAAVTVGLLRMAERVLAERLSQDYVHEIRLGLIRRNLHEGRVKSLGVAVARTTNDLTSVKNWISQGVAPLAVGIPLIIGVGVALVLLDPLLAVGLLVPVAALAWAMSALGPVAYRRTRHVRRLRGRLSSQVADTLLSTAAIRSAGGSDRELNRIERQSQGLVAASIERAKVAGAMRGVAAATSAIATATVIGTGLLAGLPTHSIAGALMVVGFLAAPLNDLGRAVEFRQTYRAARRIIGPAIKHAGTPVPRHTRPAAFPTPDARGAVLVECLPLSNGTIMPALVARPGERIVVDAGSTRLTSEVLERFVGLREAYLGQIVVSGSDLSVTSPKELRRLVGYAAQGMMLARGSISRTVRDRERGRLLLARAVLDDPPLLVFDHLDADLGRDGRTIMRRLLGEYPGVVILAGDDVGQVVTPTQLWRTDDVHRIAPTPAASAGRETA